LPLQGASTMRIARHSALALFLCLGSPANAQPAPVITVQMSNFQFAPSTIVLDHGRSYVLHLANVASGGHDFTAAEFFKAANVTPGDRRFISDSGVGVP